MRLATFSIALVLFLQSAPAFADTDYRISLHLGARASGALCGSTQPTDVPCSQFVTRGDLNTGYNLYLIASGGDPETGIAALAFSLDYEAATGTGADVFGWSLCADLSFPQANWPAPGVGNRITWSTTNNWVPDTVTPCGPLNWPRPAPSLPMACRKVPSSWWTLTRLLP